MTLGRYVCGARYEASVSELCTLVGARMSDYIRLAAGPESAIALRCVLETHAGPHADLLLDVRTDAALWACWPQDGFPDRVQWLPDCPSADQRPGGTGDGCCHFLDHPGGHSWEITDPDLMLFDAIAPELHRQHTGREWPFDPRA